MGKRAVRDQQQIMADKKKADENSAFVSGGTKKSHLRLSRRKLYILIALIALVVIGVIASILLQPSTKLTEEQAVVLKGISINDERYEDMTPVQRDAQLKRQIGYTLSELKTKNMSRMLLNDHTKAMRASHALDAIGEHKRSLAALGVAESIGGNKVDYAFYTEYASKAAANNEFDLALAKYQNAKTALNKNTSLKAADKTERLKDIEFQIAVTKARKDNPNAQ